MIRHEDTPSVEPSHIAAFVELASRVRELLSRPESRSGSRRVARVTVMTDDASSPGTPLRWLASQEDAAGYPRGYWSGRGDAHSDGRETAMIGAADFALTLEDALLEEAGSKQVRYYGSLPFDRDSERDERWSAFGAGGFVLPRTEFATEEGGESSLSCNLVLPDDAVRVEEISSHINALVPAREPLVWETLGLVSRADSPDYEGWRANIERVVAGFGREPGKVVFARRADFGFDRELDALGVLENLKNNTPGCFHLYLEPEKGTAFIGATPERLYGRNGLAVRSEAVAGTRPRGTSGEDDAGLREELLGSRKDRAEQRYVRDSIEEDLRGLCAALTVEEGVSEMKLASRRHLVSRFRGTLRPGVTDADILNTLHPTPAVGGYPKEAAIREIRDSEPFDRGCYAGPVGWVSREAAEFAVGIRSGLVRGAELSLFSGAGVVVGSTPEGEWAEIEQKISDFVDILCAEPEQPERAQSRASGGPIFERATG
ncbi:MAG: isochorismate synthase [Rubrobacter sp.]